MTKLILAFSLLFSYQSYAFNQSHSSQGDSITIKENIKLSMKTEARQKKRDRRPPPK